MRRILSILALVALGFAAESAAPARAQYTLFEFFQQDTRQAPRRYREPDRWQQRYEDGDAWRARDYYQRRMRERREVSSSSPKWKEVEKSLDAKVLLVIGDETGAGIAQGLREAFAADANARIETLTRENISLLQPEAGGLARLIKEKIEALKPAAVVIQLGTNDRANLEDNGKPVSFRSEQWRVMYMQRVDIVIQALKGRAMPVYWVGLPAARQKQMSSDVAYLNDLFRQRAYSRGVKFVDVWEGFVDENGDYIIVGPDVNGNKRRLRWRNGTTLTPAGNRKMAFYVEKELRRDVVYDVRNPASVAAINPSESMSDPIIAESYVGPVIQLTPVMAAASGAALLGEAVGSQQSQAEDVTGALSASAQPRAGRSDDFTWPLEARKPLVIGRPKRETVAPAQAVKRSKHR